MMMMIIITIVVAVVFCYGTSFPGTYQIIASQPDTAILKKLLILLLFFFKIPDI